MVQDTAERLITLSAEHGFTPQLAWATALRGWAIGQQRQEKEGISQIEEGLAALKGAGIDLGRPYWLSQLAETCIEGGRFDDGFVALTEAFALVEKNEDRNTEAELLRLKGTLLLRQDDSNAAEAQVCFRRAIEVARKQSAKSWELRTTTSLAQLLRDTGHRDEARAMLAEIYGWFTEGFDTADLKDAKALLDELSG